jgi:hypothetical protein
MSGTGDFSPAAASLTTLNSPHFLMLAQVLLS